MVSIIIQRSYMNHYGVLLGLFYYCYCEKQTCAAVNCFFTYLIWYSIGRFFVEELRTDSLMLGPLRIAQVMSIGLIVISIIFIIVRRKTGQADKRYLEK